MRNHLRQNARRFRDLCIIFQFSTNNNWNSYFANDKNISLSYLLIAIRVSRDYKNKINYLGILKLYNYFYSIIYLCSQFMYDTTCHLFTENFSYTIFLNCIKD